MRFERGTITRRGLVVGLVAQVGDPGQLLGLHLLGDLRQHLGAGDLVRQRRHHDVAILDLVDRAHAEAAATGGVHLDQLVARRDDLGGGGEVRTGHELAQFIQRDAGVLQQRHRRFRDLAQVVRRDVGGHAHGDAGGAVEQQIGQTRRQHAGLVERAVEIGLPVHRALLQLGQQGIGVG
jgi:hypothetical protein